MSFRFVIAPTVLIALMAASTSLYACGGCIQTKDYENQGSDQFENQADLQFYEYDDYPKITMGNRKDASQSKADKSEKQFDWRTDIMNMYRQPHVPKPSVNDFGKSCAQLQQELNALQPMTYSYKPRFSEDPYMGPAAWIGTTVFWPAYGVLAVGAVNHFQEKGRMVKAENRIETLQRVKARKRCFEN